MLIKMFSCTRCHIRRWAGFAFAMMMPAYAANAQDEDVPHRIAAERISLGVDHIQAGSCATRLLARSAKVTNYPARDGVGIDWTPKSGFLMSAPGDPVVSMEFRADDDGHFVIVRYRHPYSDDAALAVARKAAKVCFADDWNRWAGVHGRKAVE